MKATELPATDNSSKIYGIRNGGVTKCDICKCCGKNQTQSEVDSAQSPTNQRVDTAADAVNTGTTETIANCPVDNGGSAVKQPVAVPASRNMPSKSHSISILHRLKQKRKLAPDFRKTVLLREWLRERVTQNDMNANVVLTLTQVRKFIMTRQLQG